tara:strand:- start:249 stop:617 length:369 start_codon:yes stop_codon:yes gene_type:complete
MVEGVLKLDLNVDGQIKNGLMHEEWVEQYEDIFQKGIYLLGKREGLWISYAYDEKKYILSKENYKNGKLHGEHIDYYADGTIHIKGLFKEGKRVGEWSYYNHNDLNKYILEKKEIYKNKKLS